MMLPLSARTRVLILCLAASLVTGCASRPVTGALVPNGATAEGATSHRLLVATTRGRAEAPNTYFSGERANQRDFAEITISVPPAHVPGSIEWPDSLPGDPAKHMVTREAGYLNGAGGFQAAVRRDLAARPAKDRKVLLFIHGYNTLFAESVYRFAQVTHDAGFSGVPVLFTWASRGDFTDYVYDLNSAAVARDELEQTLEDLANSGASEVNILAHSMGTWLLMETLRQMTPAQRARLSRKVKQIVLAAPDIDVDVFKDQMRRIGKLDRPIILLLSKDDRALDVSSLIAGGKDRVGRYDDEKALAALGAVVIDLTNLEGPDAARHSKFAAFAAIAPRLTDVLQKDKLHVSGDEATGSFGSAGKDLGSFVKSTVQVAVTLPVTLVTAPIMLVTGGR
ncbi:MAG: alpha/beta hydrolase [Pannonibacter sp.]